MVLRQMDQFVHYTYLCYAMRHLKFHKFILFKFSYSEIYSNIKIIKFSNQKYKKKVICRFLCNLIHSEMGKLLHRENLHEI